jgi:N-methylhydantoinase A
MLGPEELTREAVAAAVRSLRAGLADGIDAETETISYELRYQGQSFELPVEAGAEPTPEELADGFARAHEQRYGFETADAPVELVAIRLALEGAAPEPEPRAASGAFEEGSRRVRFADEWHETLVGRGEPPAGAEFEGPAVLELPESTLVLPPGWSAIVDEHGSLLADLKVDR